MKTRLASWILLLTLPLLTQAQYRGTALTLKPTRPQPGHPVTLSYNPARGKIGGDTDVTGIVYWFCPQGEPVARNFTLKQNGTTYQTTLMIPDTATSMALLFERRDEVDNNKGKAYAFLLYDSAGAVLANSYGSLSQLYTTSLYTGGKTELNFKLASQLLGQERAPDAKRRYMIQYLTIAYEEPTFLSMLRSYAALSDLTQKEQETIRMCCYGVKSPMQADSISQQLEQTYGKPFDWPGAYEHFRAQKRTLAEMKTEFATIRQQATRAGQSATADHFHRYSYSIYLKALADSAQWSAFQRLIDQAPVSFAPNTMGAYNAIARDWATRGVNLEKATELAQVGTAWAKKRINGPREVNDLSYRTDRQVAQDRLSAYGTYADTYGYVLLAQGRAVQALPYLKEAVAAKGRKDVEINQRYVQTLVQLDPAAVPAEVERFILDKHSSKVIEEALKGAYITIHGNDSGFASYLANLRDKSLEQQRVQLRQQRLQQPAPAFSLLNLEGKPFGLADLKGKTVVMDFWATWCGPCLASFPGMQKAIEKYKNDPNVAFVFINTWQRETDKKKIIGELLAQEGYTFNVLLDEKEQVISAYNVKGIPTKFVIDRTGMIRFKSSGAPTDPDALVDELTLMIALANESIR